MYLFRYIYNTHVQTARRLVGIAAWGHRFADQLDCALRISHVRLQQKLSMQRDLLERKWTVQGNGLKLCVYT